MLVPLVPIFAALSAASPIYRGQLATHDHSWPVFERMTDSFKDDDHQMGGNFAMKPRFAAV